MPYFCEAAKHSTAPRVTHYIDLKQKTLQPPGNPLGTRLSPMVQGQTVAYVSGSEGDLTPASNSMACDSEGNVIAQEVIQQEIMAGDRYGLRYEECFAVEAAYQRRRFERLEQRFEDLAA